MAPTPNLSGMKGRLSRLLLACCVGGLALGSCGGGEPPWRLLVFTKTAGFRHGSIPAGRACVQELGQQYGFDVDLTEDAATFTDEGLAPYSVVVFLNTTGDVLGPERQAAFERFVRGGAGFVGVHSASDTEYEWDWYGRLVGAWFDRHPAVQKASIHVLAPEHPASAHLPDPWTRIDEWYDFQAAPPPTVDVLLRLDESTYEGGGMGKAHPVAWCQEFDGGRSFYTALGHTIDSYSEPAFRKHLVGGILWAAEE